MDGNRQKVSAVLSGWDGYNRSLISAIAPRSAEELRYRPVKGGRSAGEIAAHIAEGRVDWFTRMGASGAAELLQAHDWGHRDLSDSPDAIVHMLELSWSMVAANLDQWVVDDLGVCYHQEYGGNTYSVSRQWVIFRILAHDMHHGGQLSMLFFEQGIELPDLGDNGGHIIEPPLVTS